MGKPSLFPLSTDILVGPDVKAKFAPGYPENESAPFRSQEWKGRTVNELDFQTSPLEIGHFEAIDYFHDGSLCFLSASGHAIGHVLALARTTAPDSGDGMMSPSTFILIGADSCKWRSLPQPHSLPAQTK
jgi:hypothetical protein